MLYANHSNIKLAALAFAVFMTVAVEGSMLLRFDAMAQASPAHITLPTVTIYAPQA